MNERSDTSRLEVWMDGDCPVCRASRRFVEARDRDSAISFRDFRRTPDAALPVPRRRLEKEMWVRAEDGSLVAGYAAWRRIMARLRGWRWLAALGSLPLLRSLGSALYRVIARYRLGLVRRRSRE